CPLLTKADIRLKWADSGFDPQQTSAGLKSCTAQVLTGPSPSGMLLAPAGGDQMQRNQLKRREFIALLGGAATAWPLTARAQQPSGMRRIGVLIPLAMDDPEAKARIAVFQQGLEQLGWIDGRNVQIDTRWAGGDMESIRKHAVELVALSPDVILAAGGAAMTPLHQATRTVPIVFTQTPDPVGAGFVASLARPGGNATGFTLFEFGISVKWLELLKEIAPNVARAAALRDPAYPPGLGELGAIRGVAPTLRV